MVVMQLTINIRSAVMVLQLSTVVSGMVVMPMRRVVMHMCTVVDMLTMDMRSVVMHMCTMVRRLRSSER